tara:strand:- start:1842 stop:2237 length:396 start_codon:yes stop_codon:yes gene_type:complete
MFEVKVRDNLFIAHSLKEDFFGDAKNLHGATYVIDVIIASNEINKMNVVIDIGLASKILKKCISVYNYKNLDDIKDLKDYITTTEFMAKRLTDDFIVELQKIKFDLSPILFIKIILNESHIASASYKKLLG